MRALRQLWFLITRRRQENDLADEIEFHRQMKAEELRADGVREAEVASRTQRALGNDLLARERSRDVWVAPWLQDITQDVRFGARMLAKDRRFTIAAVVALGVGIGINNSVFTIMNAALFRPLPFEESERLVEPRLVDAQGRDGQVSYADFLNWRAAATSFEGLTGDQSTTMNISEDGLPAARVRGTYLTANTFAILRVAPLMGRDFIAEDERPGAPPVAMLAYDVWQSRYGGEPSVVGRTIRINSVPTTVIGVMPQGFAYPLYAQLWQPLSLAPNLDPANRSARVINVSARLAPGVDLAQATADLQTIAAQIAEAHPQTNKDLRVRLTTLQASYSGDRQAWIILSTLMGAVTFVLLIACANVASLLLARSAHRSREIAIRASLGAGRWRIVRQLLIECLLISMVAAVAGLVLSRFLAGIMSRAFDIYEIGAPGGTVKPYWADISLDTMTLMFLGFVCLLASVLVGLMPSWHLSRTNANDVLKEGGRAGGPTRRARRMTGGLLIGQLALTLILLSSAGLMIRTYLAVSSTDLVIDPTGIVTMRIVLPVPKYAGVSRQRQFITELDRRLTALPVFSAVALGSDIPLHPLGFASRRLTLDRPWPGGGEAPEVFFVTVGPRYLETLGIQVRRGRPLTPFDALPGQEGAIVNERFAARYFPGAEALGKRIRLTGPNFNAELAPWFTIVGVAQSLPNFFAHRAGEALVYLPTEADPGPQRAVSVIVRTRDGDGMKAAAAATLREEVAAIDSDLPVFGIQTLREASEVARGPSRMIGSWFLTIAIAALLLATVGLYALTAQSVAQRAQEIGVRMALGARAGQVVWLFVRRTVIQLLIGLTLGLAGATASGQLLTSAQSGVSPRDPLTLSVATMLLIVVALLASFWPARKAARVDPIAALRAD